MKNIFILLVLLNFIACTSSSSKLCSNKIQRIDLIETNTSRVCKSELELCRMQNYKQTVDLEQCKKDNSWWQESLKALVVGSLGILSGYLYAEKK